MLEELDGEDPGVFRRQDAEHLLKAEDDEENAGDHETGDRLAGVPGIDHTAEIDCHNARRARPNHQDCSEIVQLQQTRFVWDTRSWIVRRKHEKIYWGTDCAKEDFERLSRRTRMTKTWKGLTIDVESEAPSDTTVSKSTSNYLKTKLD